VLERRRNNLWICFEVLVFLGIVKAVSTQSATRRREPPGACQLVIRVRSRSPVVPDEDSLLW
jgi:hypothetical protein